MNNYDFTENANDELKGQRFERNGKTYEIIDGWAGGTAYLLAREVGGAQQLVLEQGYDPDGYVVIGRTWEDVQEND